MQLHNRLSQLFQKETDRLLKSFLSDNPDLLKKYVDSGVTVVGVALAPLNVFMRHLLTVQGLDPDSIPGEKERLALHEALTNFFSKNHEKDFDEDYDMSWVRKKFEEARGHLGKLNLTEDKFKELTDLSRIPSPILPGRYPTIEEEQEYMKSAPSNRLPDKEIRVRVEDKKEEVKPKFDPGNPIQALRDAVDAIEKEVGLDKKKAGIKTGKKKLNKKSGPGTRVRRVIPTPTEVKENPPKIGALKENVKAKFDASRKLVNDMVACGLVENNDDAKHEQIQQILLMDEGAVASLSRVVAKHAKPTTSNFNGSFRRITK
jgi:hypothetical protein